LKLNGYSNIPSSLLTAKPQDEVHVLQMLAIQRLNSWRKRRDEKKAGAGVSNFRRHNM